MSTFGCQDNCYNSYERWWRKVNSKIGTVFISSYSAYLFKMSKDSFSPIRPLLLKYQVSFLIPQSIIYSGSIGMKLYVWLKWKVLSLTNKLLVTIILFFLASIWTIYRSRRILCQVQELVCDPCKKKAFYPRLHRVVKNSPV